MYKSFIICNPHKKHNMSYPYTTCLIHKSVFKGVGGHSETLWSFSLCVEEEKWEGGNVYKKLAQIVLCDVKHAAEFIFMDFCRFSRFCFKLLFFLRTPWHCLKIIYTLMWYGRGTPNLRVQRLHQRLSSSFAPKIAWNPFQSL